MGSLFFSFKTSTISFDIVCLIKKQLSANFQSEYLPRWECFFLSGQSCDVPFHRIIARRLYLCPYPPFLPLFSSFIFPFIYQLGLLWLALRLISCLLVYQITQTFVFFSFKKTTFFHPPSINQQHPLWNWPSLHTKQTNIYLMLPYPAKEIPVFCRYAVLVLSQNPAIPRPKTGSEGTQGQEGNGYRRPHLVRNLFCLLFSYHMPASNILFLLVSQWWCWRTNPARLRLSTLSPWVCTVSKKPISLLGRRKWWD